MELLLAESSIGRKAAKLVLQITKSVYPLKPRVLIVYPFNDELYDSVPAMLVSVSVTGEPQPQSAAAAFFLHAVTAPVRTSKTTSKPDRFNLR